MNKKFKYKHDNGFVSSHYNKIMQTFDGLEFYIKRELSDGFVEAVLTGCDYPILRLSKKTLQEIKEPMTLDEYFSSIGKIKNIDTCLYQFLKDCHEWTIKNERLKHEPKQNSDQAYHDFEKSGLLSEPLQDQQIWFEYGWNANEKNRGYDV